VWTRPQTDFSIQNLGFWNFQQQKSLKNQYLPHSEPKSFQINSIKSCSLRSFQQNQRHVPIPQLRFNLIFSEKSIQYSRRSFALEVQMPWNQADATLLLEGFPKRPRTRSEASQFSGSHKYKQNKINQNKAKTNYFPSSINWN
jgi:hypothetical protein